MSVSEGMPDEFPVVDTDVCWEEAAFGFEAEAAVLEVIYQKVLSTVRVQLRTSVAWSVGGFLDGLRPRFFSFKYPLNPLRFASHLTHTKKVEEFCKTSILE